MNFIDTTVIDTYYQKSQQLKDLSPCPEVNYFFEELCDFCMKEEKNVPKHESIEKIQSICSAGECLMEKDISQKIIVAENPWKELEDFTYFKNYLDLTTLEYLNLGFYTNVSQVLFIGCGSLPLTAILLAKKYNIHCTLIDYDENAIILARELIDSLGLSGSMNCIHSDAFSYTDQKKYDVCYIAALVWSKDEKQRQLLTHLQKSITASHFLMRSSDGAREILYKKISLPILQEHMQIEQIIHPKNHIINSIIIAKAYEQ